MDQKSKFCLAYEFYRFYMFETFTFQALSPSKYYLSRKKIVFFFLKREKDAECSKTEIYVLVKKSYYQNLLSVTYVFRLFWIF